MGDVEYQSEESEYEYEYEYEYVDSDEEKKLNEDRLFLASLAQGRKRSASLSLGAKNNNRKGNLKTTGLDDGDKTTGGTQSNNHNRHYASAGLGVGSVCTRCLRERHAPVRDCDLVSLWIKKRQQIPTVEAQHIHLCLKKFIRDCAERFDVDTVKAGVMCRQDNWDMGQIAATNQLRNRLTTNAAEQVIPTRQNDADRRLNPTELGGLLQTTETVVATPPAVTGSTSMPSNDLPETTCAICFDEDVSMMRMDCGHGFCRSCWRGYIETVLGEGSILNVAFNPTCPHAGCAEPITEVQMESIAPDLMPNFEELQLNAFVYSNRRTLRWCPGPDCTCIAVKPRDDAFEDCSLGFLCCRCSLNFCFTCGERPHDGPCVLTDLPGIQGVNVPINHSSIGNEKNKKPIKLCPKCKIPIEKNGGCNHMTCKCGNHFCWLCLKSDTDYSHFCGAEGTTLRLQPLRIQIDINLDYVAAALNEGNASDDTRSEFEGMQAAMARYAHYYNRYHAHRQGQRFAEGQCPCLENRAHNYTQMAGILTGTDIDFIRSANETLVASRRLLKYSYCSAYHYHDEETARLGFYHLEQLERFTEELSGLSENALSRKDRSRVIDLISVVTKAMGAVADFEFEATSRG